jgi:hypothetical protein
VENVPGVSGLNTLKAPMQVPATGPTVGGAVGFYHDSAITWPGVSMTPAHPAIARAEIERVARRAAQSLQVCRVFLLVRGWRGPETSGPATSLCGARAQAPSSAAATPRGGKEKLESISLRLAHLALPTSVIFQQVAPEIRVAGETGNERDDRAGQEGRRGTEVMQFGVGFESGEGTTREEAGGGTAVVGCFCCM